MERETGVGERNRDWSKRETGMGDGERERQRHRDGREKDR